MDDALPASGRASANSRSRAALALTATLLVSAAALFWHPWLARSAPPQPPPVGSQFTDPATVRKVPSRLTALDEDGERQPCGECHEDHDGLLGDNPNPTHTVGEPHDKIVLHHGRNNRCFNCHHENRREYFSDYAGNPIIVKGPDGKRDLSREVLQLCPKCHGPHYRDWLSGAHGRRSGYWNADQGAMQTQPCIACHDPHWPVFKRLKPAPPPHTLHAPATSKHE